MSKQNKILIVDDTEINRALLSAILSEEYEILEAANGIEAIACINRFHSELSLILLDIVMPEMDGFEVLEVLNGNRYIDSIPVIIISAENSAVYVDHAYDLGAVEYINRPFDTKTVKHRVKNTIMLFSKQKRLEEMLSEQMLEKEKVNLIMLEVLSNIVEFRNEESGLHVLHIRVITENLLRRLVKLTDKYKLSPADIMLISNASAMHDIGKISVPENILNKPGKLTPEEYDIIKSHCAAGADMLGRVTFFESERLIQVARDICRWHHERWDGSGYPDGLKGEEIPISAQAVAVADVYDALISRRVYKPAYSHKDALDTILRGECGSFNPLLLQCLKDLSPYFEKELTLRSTNRISKRELRDTAYYLMQNASASTQMLSLLDQERIKHVFFANISNEIQFEHDIRTNVLTISDWGAQKLGLPNTIMHSSESSALAHVFAPEDYNDIKRRLRMATPENPIVTQKYCLNVNGAKRWYRAVARPLWLNDDTTQIIGTIGKLVDIHEEQLENAQTKNASLCDPLTDLYSKTRAKKLISNALKKADSGRKFALIVINIDSFMSLNNAFGHLFGDEVLTSVASALRSLIGNKDIAARTGGDEFLIFIEYKDNILPYAERIFEACSGEYKGCAFSSSMGVAATKQNGDDFDDLLRRAKQALHFSKQNGKNQFCIYDESMKDDFLDPSFDNKEV